MSAYTVIERERENINEMKRMNLFSSKQRQEKENIKVKEKGGVSSEWVSERASKREIDSFSFKFNVHRRYIYTYCVWLNSQCVYRKSFNFLRTHTQTLSTLLYSTVSSLFTWIPKTKSLKTNFFSYVHFKCTSMYAHKCRDLLSINIHLLLLELWSSLQ